MHHKRGYILVISESAEMYLETILVLSKTGPVRSIDVARTMKFSRPSVSVTLHNLENDGYVIFQEDGKIILTEKGKAIAERIYERHEVLSAILEYIGVSPATAADDACKFEHDISDETFNCLKKFFQNSIKN